MTVAIESGYTLADGKHARIMHEGVALPFSVDAAGTTDAASNTFAKANVRNGLTSDRYKAESNTWTIEIDLNGGAADVTGICVGSDGIFSAGGTVAVRSDADSFAADIVSGTPTDDSPVMFLFDTVNAETWRIIGSGTSAPEIYNVMIGNPLVMQRAFYGGFSPARMNRQTEVIGNISRSGELLGRSIKRTVLAVSYSWTNLTYPWVKSNLRGPSGLIQSVEAKQAYVAWRPSVEGDVDYLMRAQTNAPQAQGVSNLWSFSMSGEVHSYE